MDLGKTSRHAALMAALCLASGARAEPAGPQGLNPDPGRRPQAPAAIAPPGPAGGVAPAGVAPTLVPEIQPAAGPKAPLPIPEPVKLPDDPLPTLSPQTAALLAGAIERYGRIVAAGGWPVVANDLTRLKPGDRSPTIKALRARLAASDDLPGEAKGGDAFDGPLAEGLRRFQRRHGLEETGLVGPRTLSALNMPATARLAQLQASAARLAASRFPFGERYVAVNIPAQTVEAIAGGVVARRFVAVVGKVDRPSPTVETRIGAVNFNPTWTVPVSLIKKDIIPHVRKEPGYLARMKIRILDGSGAVVDPARIDWSTEEAAHYTVRQDAGEDNSLGEVRIDMPNQHAVYMHDTPSKRLFARTRRFHSSGCVRVAGVKDLAAWILDGAPGPRGQGSAWGQAEIEFAIASGQRINARPARPIPVAWVYLTGWATSEGRVHFRDDPYGLDAPRDAAPREVAPRDAAPREVAPRDPLPGPAAGARPPAVDAQVTGSIRPSR